MLFEKLKPFITFEITTYNAYSKKYPHEQNGSIVPQQK